MWIRQTPSCLGATGTGSPRRQPRRRTGTKLKPRGKRTPHGRRLRGSLGTSDPGEPPGLGAPMGTACVGGAQGGQRVCGAPPWEQRVWGAPQGDSVCVGGRPRWRGFGGGGLAGPEAPHSARVPRSQRGRSPADQRADPEAPAPPRRLLPTLPARAAPRSASLAVPRIKPEDGLPAHAVKGPRGLGPRWPPRRRGRSHAVSGTRG